ncbi:hypothetical protein WEI85_17755 [Actinomycetes bacterium KLBMP 9797]
MTIARTLRAATAASLLALAAACAQTSETGAPEQVTGDQAAAGAGAEADEVALRIEHIGGFVSPSMIAGRLPTATVYSDGRVISEGPQTMQYPGPALPNVQVARITAAEVDALVQRAIAAGVGSAGDLGQPGVADAPTTRLTVRGDGGEKTTDVYALSEGAGGAGLTDAQKAARQKLSALVTEVSGLSAKATSTEQYEPAALAVYATPWTVSDVTMDKQPEVAWPGPALPGTTVGGAALNMGCVTVTGDATATVLAAAAKANAATPWTSAGKRWHLTVRPILPDEPADCATLAKE